MNELEYKVLDMLIAEHVMGFEIVLATKEHPVVVNGCKVARGKWLNTGRTHEWGPIAVPIPRYSTDVALAFVVLEKVRELNGGHFTLLAFPTGWRAGVDTGWVSAEALTAQLAICLTALPLTIRRKFLHEYSAD